MIERVVENAWRGLTSRDRLVRSVLTPVGRVYEMAMDVRNALYDRGVFRAHLSELPVLSLGNLTVGGTGKTPLAAWAATRLSALGGRPAIILRGYGGDEAAVHARLNPDFLVVADVDRLRGVARARALGADCAVLDDAFQHRRIQRLANWLLIAAEQWRDDLHVLPAGPLRESSRGMRRADVLVVTRKSATRTEAEALEERLKRQHGVRQSAICAFALDTLVSVHGSAQRPLSWLAKRPVLAVAAVGMPQPFFDQVAAAGAIVTAVSFPDHHAFTQADVRRLMDRGREAEAVVCTLKDAVKLAPLWPRVPPALWYVSQRAVIERGDGVLDASLQALLSARAGALSTAGPSGSSSRAHGHRPSFADE